MAGPEAVRRRWRALAGSLATAALFALAAPPFGVWPLAFVCLTPLLAALEGRSLAARAQLGALAGTAAALLTVVQPLGLALARFFEAPVAVGVFAAVLVGSVFGGGGFAVFAALVGDPTLRRPWSVALRAGAAWVLADAFRSSLLTGLPWLLLGDLLASAPAVAQLAAWGGVAGLSFWVACGSGAMHALCRPGRRGVGAVLAACLLLPGIVAWLGMPPTQGPGSVRVAAASRTDPDVQRVALVQPAVDPAWRSDPARAADIASRLAALSGPAGPVDLLVWPENALPVLLPANAHLVEDVLESLPARPARLLMGAPRSARDRPGVVFNSAMLFDAAGRPLDAHDKVHLVPFTEYLPVPFSALDSGRSWLAAGASPRTLELEQGVRLGPLVCYEMLFAGLARELVAEGAGFLVNLSNDGWFGGTAGAEQHLAAAVLRAIELRRPVLRATSDGITVAIDAGGRMVGRLPSAAPGALVVDVVPARHPSVGMQAGRWLPLAAGVGLILLARTSTRAKPPRTS